MELCRIISPSLKAPHPLLLPARPPSPPLPSLPTKSAYPGPTTPPTKWPTELSAAWIALHLVFWPPPEQTLRTARMQDLPTAPPTTSESKPPTPRVIPPGQQLFQPLRQPRQSLQV